MNQYTLLNAKSPKYDTVIAGLQAIDGASVSIVMSDNNKKSIVKTCNCTDQQIIDTFFPEADAEDTLEELVASGVANNVLYSAQQRNYDLLTLYYSDEFSDQRPSLEDAANG